MTLRNQIEIESTTLLLVVAAGVMLAFTLGQKNNQSKKLLIPISATVQSESPIPTLTPSPTPAAIPKPEFFSQLSPDGTKDLSMSVITNKDLSKTYTFTVSDGNGVNRLIVYSATYAQDMMIIPFNTWSPDNKYIFIKHIVSGSNEEIVLKADGTPFPDGEYFINVTALFKNKISTNVYDQVTGWASDSLLVINTKTIDGNKSTSYWFEVPGKAIIPLSTQF